MSLKNFIPISLWDQRDQPREKLDRFGPKALSNAELIAILLQNGYRGVSALELSKQLLSFYEMIWEFFQNLPYILIKKLRALEQQKRLC